MYPSLSFPEGVAWLPEHPSPEMTHFIEFNDLPMLEGQTEPFCIKDLCEELENDLEGAMKKYQGFRFEVKGVVTAYGIDPHNLPAVQLSDKVGGKIFAQCIFLKAREDEIMNKVNVGDEITVRGNYLVMSNKLGLILKHSDII